MSGDQIFVVDLDLPGVWEINAGKTLFSKGSNLLRKAMNRPHCVTSHPSGGILVGDSATREVYWIEKQARNQPLTNGYIGIPMALAVAPDGKTLYVGDAEKRATFRLPIEGGECELVARVNAGVSPLIPMGSCSRSRLTRKRFNELTPALVTLRFSLVIVRISSPTPFVGLVKKVCH